MDKVLAFAKGAPTLFVLDTPFQLLCAMEFIAEFAIEDYLIIAQLTKGEKRNEQVIQMLNENGLKYEINWIEDYWGMVKTFLDYSCSAPSSFRSFPRVVIGDYNALDQWVTASRHAYNGTSIVFTDDGNSSIKLLNCGHGKNTEYEVQFFEHWGKNNIDCTPCIYTIYADILTKQFVTYSNNLSSLASRLSIDTAPKSVYVIGTNSAPYCCAMGISIRDYEKILWKKLTELKRKFPRDEIIYIPHGRDSHDMTKIFCKRLGITFHQLHCAVEYYFVGSGNYAKAIYGFGSTALLTLKKLMPDTEVVNWVIDNPKGEYFDEYSTMAAYYNQHGVTTERIPYYLMYIWKMTKFHVKKYALIFKKIITK